MKTKMMMRTLPATILITFSGATLASGFALQNQTGSGNGNAFAGAAAAAEDAGTIFFNPAGVAFLPEGTNVSLAATHIERVVHPAQPSKPWGRCRLRNHVCHH